MSKGVAEIMVHNSNIPEKTIFKPSIVLGTKEYPYYGHFSQFAGLLIRVHQRAEKIRRGVEDIMRLPPIRPLFRVEGNKDGNLNLVKLDDVVGKMVSFTGEGTCWLTNPNPPKLGYLLKLIGEEAMVNAVFEKGFKPSVVESQFARMMKAFQPYLEGDDMPSDIEKCELGEDYLRWTINNQFERG
jgi:nucleoside-diphosphate-sugar epimerase